MRKNMRRKDRPTEKTINVTTPNEEASLDPSPMKGKIVNAALVNLRSDLKDPLNSEVIGILSEGESVEILKKTEHVLMVKTKEHKIGYVFSKYVEEMHDERT